MVFFRNVQARWMPSKGTHDLVFAVERPGASGDQGVYDDRVELDGIRARFPLPDFSGAYKYKGDWGYVRAAGILRRINWDDTLDDGLDLSGDATGWGLNLSSNINLGSSSVIRIQYVFGEGIQNYMNDSPIDIGIVNNFSDPLRPIVGEPIPIHRARALPRPHLEQPLHQLGRLLATGQRQHRRARAGRVPQGANTRSATCSTRR